MSYQTLPKMMMENTGGLRAGGYLAKFDQQEFFDNRAAEVSMDSEGFIYVPER